MAEDEEIGDLGLDSVFTEPPRPPTPEPTIAVYDREQGGQIKIRLVGSHPLWGHYLWNASRAFASYLEANPSLTQNKCVLELGAGGGLPSIIAIHNEARKVVVTDYPDAELVQNMKYNIKNNTTATDQERVSVQGYIWGHPVKPLLSSLTPEPSSNDKFDLIVLSDLIFNHSQHDAMLKTCEDALRLSSDAQESSTPMVLVFYSHHRPKLAHRDMEFFEKARVRGWVCTKILTKTYPPMFPDDPGEVDVRSTVHGWSLVRAN
ncbi:nicotinamide n-methyltransferase [Pleurotus ostreatus]|uniref:Protein N-terminal and lysine N-methyltransferase EFM7 n=1 Tax=Pleurotus ostreatus TaxID=5322 RepID=A0A8H7DTE4_PLEOS|nr:nicotinamide n-methyltransferase [Pleurotus ostreatus]KAF7426391.1 nicotinamide n-methyltransferase [Pleurotus ostreatus]KAJ8693914.1 Protein N-terminal and lysine N-methyltransferase efm7, variant 2 [Pleurotus ostreatus]